MALSATIYRLASSMSDYTPVLFNVSEDWNEESLVPHISFVSFAPLTEHQFNHIICQPLSYSLFSLTVTIRQLVHHSHSQFIVSLCVGIQILAKIASSSSSGSCASS